MIQTQHYQPKPIDDSLSVYVFNTVINNFDTPRFVLTKSEYDRLSRHRLKIDDYILEGNCNFIKDFEQILQNGISRKIAMIKAIEKEISSVNVTQTIEFSNKKFEYLTTENEIKNLLKKKIIFDILYEIAQTSKNKDSIVLNFAQLQKQYKKQTFEEYYCLGEHKMATPDTFSTEIEDLFLKAFSQYFDPHTTYLSQNDRTTFLNGVSEDNASFGLHFAINNSNEFYVAEIIPGSSAFDSDAIEPFDKLVKVKTMNGDEVFANCSTFDIIQNYLQSQEFKNLLFSFEKKDGTTYEVQLVKKNIKSIQNKCYSYVMDYEGKKLGYLNIPSFYTDENGSNTMTNDVAIELLNLKKDNIQGLIIDLKNNGGGDINEAIKLSGMFIDIGPVAVMTQKNGNNMLLRDVNRGSFYRGPMIVLVNGNSASGSEFFANAMQDYKRALLVGSKTFGKATMQQIFPLDSTSTVTDYVKITTEKFYRVTGKSNQKTGLLPDVEIPDIFDTFSKKEDKLDNALPNDSIENKTRFQPLHTNFSKIAANSQKRVTASQYYQTVTNYQDYFNTIFKKNTSEKITLTIDGVFNYVHKHDAVFDSFKGIASQTYVSTITPTSTDLEKLKFDTVLNEISNKRIEQLKRNFDILESAKILVELNTK
ncbi:S41 family peptidase [Flavobacterium sp. NRK F10]|uniref:S41 family peptidase n=1 Tax=Flavobacterium TaxID=237 RepID=UPI0014736D28|nr:MULTISPECIES: S41 family peptidase [Flavobacterium]MCO6176201.1 S41 family peptidase [Flavobacterium sp. NRK F10]